SVQIPATFSPERCTTASNPETSAGATGCVGFHRVSRGDFGRLRTSRVTWTLWASRNETRAEPIRPEAPLTRTRDTREFYIPPCPLDIIRTRGNRPPDPFWVARRPARGRGARATHPEFPAGG